VGSGMVNAGRAGAVTGQGRGDPPLARLPLPRLPHAAAGAEEENWGAGLTQFGSPGPGWSSDPNAAQRGVCRAWVRAALPRPRREQGEPQLNSSAEVMLETPSVPSSPGDHED